MTLLSTNLPFHGFRVTNLPSTPGSSLGTTLTAGGSTHTLGSWVELLSAASMTQDIVGLYLNANTLAAAGATNRIAAMEIGIDPAGGTSYTTLIPGIVVGNAASNLVGTGIGRLFYFPIRIPAGASVAGRMQAGVASTTISALVIGYGQSSNPTGFFVGQYAEAIGYQSAGSQGVNFVPGNGAWGSWVSVGTAVNPLRWLQFGMGSTDTSMTAIYAHVEVAYGDTTNKHKVADISIAHTTGEVQGDSLMGNLIPGNAMCPVPAGAEFFVRGWSSAAVDNNYSMSIVGIG